MNERARQLEEVRAAIEALRDADVAPPHDIAARALVKLRSRDRDVAGVNETIGAFETIGRAIAHFIFGRRS